MAEPALLVAREVTSAKIAAHLADWDRNSALYRSRGWFLTRAAGTLIEIAFAAPNLSPGYRIIPAAIRLDYVNYDIWPPSLTFIDALTGEPAPPAGLARKREGDTYRDLIVQGHPETGRPFLCLPGIREYHNHPQHSGDLWLRYRSQRMGAPSVVAAWIWQYMTGTVTRLAVNIGILLQQEFPELGEPRPEAGLAGPEGGSTD